MRFLHCEHEPATSKLPGKLETSSHLAECHIIGRKSPPSSFSLRMKSLDCTPNVSTFPSTAQKDCLLFWPYWITDIWHALGSWGRQKTKPLVWTSMLALFTAPLPAKCRVRGRKSSSPRFSPGRESVGPCIKYSNFSGVGTSLSWELAYSKQLGGHWDQRR